MKHYIDSINRTLNWDSLLPLSQELVKQAIAIQQIPAPTFDEARRAAYVRDQYAKLRLEQVTIDDVNNVYGLIPGQNRDLPGVLILAHTDTVFSADTDLATRVEGGVVFGPGLGDNSIGVAGVLALASFLKQQNITPLCDLWLLANSCEEGLGDLKGIKSAFEKLRNRIQMVINVEGLALGHIYHAGIAVRRLKITAFAEGGHSWLHYGRQSAIHGLIELGSHITRIHPVHTPRTTYNIGIIEGGHSINSIATEASMWLDMRSENTEALADLERQVRDEIEKVSNPDLEFVVEVVGDRPSGLLDPQHPLVQGALGALAQVGIKGMLETGSTDANIPLAAGHPAVTVGITRGGNAHRLDEFVETGPVHIGLHQLVLLTLAAASFQAAEPVGL